MLMQDHLLTKWYNLTKNLSGMFGQLAANISRINEISDIKLDGYYVLMTEYK